MHILSVYTRTDLTQNLGRGDQINAYHCQNTESMAMKAKPLGILYMYIQYGNHFLRGFIYEYKI